MLSLALVAFFIALPAALWLRRLMRRSGVHYADDAPQRVHAGETPRVGGIAMLLGWALALAALPLLQKAGMAGNLQWERLHLPQWLLVLAPAFVGAVAEDMTQRVRVWLRLLLTLGSGALAAALLDAAVPRLGFAWVDALWQAQPLAGAALAVLAITGLPHAFNLIDGYNGLAGSVALVVSLALAHVAMQVGDRELAAAAITLAAATAGFLMWNWPLGLVFAGDAGAYLWGLVIAVVSVLLVKRHDLVSPWFPMLLLMYPVWETLFSIWRKLRHGLSPGMADALHMHHLIARRLILRVLDEDEAQAMLARNNRTAPYLMGFVVLTVVPAVLLWRSSAALAALCALFAVSYSFLYARIVHFRTPRILRPSRF